MNKSKKALEVLGNAQWYNNWVFSFFKDYCRGDILEIGSGLGNFSELLSKEGKVTGLDINTQYIEILKKKFGKRIDFGFGDIEKNRYFFPENKKFDTAICLNVLEHIKNDDKALKNMQDILKSGGYLVLLVPAHDILFGKFDKDIGHFRRYSKKSLKKELERLGFLPQEVRYLNWWGAIGWWFWFKLIGKKTMPDTPVSIFDKLGCLFIGIEKYVRLPFGLSVLVIAKRK